MWRADSHQNVADLTTFGEFKESQISAEPLAGFAFLDEPVYRSFSIEASAPSEVHPSGFSAASSTAQACPSTFPFWTTTEEAHSLEKLTTRATEFGEEYNTHRPADEVVQLSKDLQLTSLTTGKPLFSSVALPIRLPEIPPAPVFFEPNSTFLSMHSSSEIFGRIGAAFERSRTDFCYHRDSFRMVAVAYPDNNSVLFGVRLFKSHDPKLLLVEFHRQSGPLLSFRRYFNQTVEQLGDVAVRVLDVSSLAEITRSDTAIKQKQSKTKAVLHADVATDVSVPVAAMCSLPSVPIHMLYQPCALPPALPAPASIQQQAKHQQHDKTHARGHKTAPQRASTKEAKMAEQTTSTKGSGEQGSEGDGDGDGNQPGKPLNPQPKPPSVSAPALSGLPPLSSLKPMPALCHRPSSIAKPALTTSVVEGFTPCAMHLEKDNDESIRCVNIDATTAASLLSMAASPIAELRQQGLCALASLSSSAANQAILAKSADRLLSIFTQTLVHKDAEIARCAATLMANIAQQAAVRTVLVDRVLPLMFDVLDAGAVRAEAESTMNLYDDERQWQILASREVVRQVSRCLLALTKTQCAQILKHSQSRRYIASLRSLEASEDKQLQFCIRAVLQQMGQPLSAA